MKPALPLYAMYDASHLMLAPWRFAAVAMRDIMTTPHNPLRETFFARSVAAANDVFERMTRVYEKPPFAIASVEIAGCTVPIIEEVALDTPFCKLLHFRRNTDAITTTANPATTVATADAASANRAATNADAHAASASRTATDADAHAASASRTATDADAHAASASRTATDAATDTAADANAFAFSSRYVAGSEPALAASPVASSLVANVAASSDAVRAAKSAIKDQQPLLLVAPLSGHYASLLRATVAEMARHADVYVTDWTNASEVPLTDGPFSFHDYVKLVRRFITHLGPATHVMAVCQPSVPVIAAIAMMNEDKDPATPRSVVLMGGPIDTRVNPQETNRFAASHTIEWFAENMVHRVPFGHAGAGREVCPGFMQLAGFMIPNLERHAKAYNTYFLDMLSRADASAKTHRDFYDVYNAVLDMPAEYYLETVDYIFLRHLLPRGELVVDGRKIDLGAITETAVMTVEGGRDDITGPGQTRAVHALLTNLPSAKKDHFDEPEVGHYGVFSGSRWVRNIAPAVAAFQKKHTAPGR